VARGSGEVAPVEKGAIFPITRRPLPGDGLFTLF